MRRTVEESPLVALRPRNGASHTGGQTVNNVPGNQPSTPLARCSRASPSPAVGCPVRAGYCPVRETFQIAPVPGGNSYGVPWLAELMRAMPKSTMYSAPSGPNLT